MCLQVGWGALAEESGHAPMGPPTTLLEQPVQHVLPADAGAQGTSPALQAHFNPLLLPS